MEYLDNLENPDKESTPTTTPINNNLNINEVENSNQFTPQPRTKQWLEIPLNTLPGYRYYTPGTRISIRPAITGEIQAYSTIDNRNSYDVDTKMRDMLSTCCRLTKPSGELGTYREIFEADKLFIITQISKLTRKDGKTVKKSVKCSNGHDVEIDLIPEHFELAEPNEEIEEFYSSSEACYVFPLINGQTIKLGIPKIGLLQDIYEYTMVKVLSSQSSGNPAAAMPNVTFMKCIPYMNYTKEKLDVKDIEQMEHDFKHMDDETFMFIDEAVDKIICGISHLKKKCNSCGVETRIPFSLYSIEGGPRSLFVVPNAFGKLIRK